MTPLTHPLLPKDAVSPWVANAMQLLDYGVSDHIRKAKLAGVPQSVIVALLHAHALEETNKLLTEGT